MKKKSATEDLDCIFMVTPRAIVRDLDARPGAAPVAGLTVYSISPIVAPPAGIRPLVLLHQPV
jgi:hypothetical protein